MFRRSLAVLAFLLAVPAGSRAQEAGDFEASLDPRVRGYLEAFATPGAAVALIENGRIVLERGYGRADAEGAVPVTPATGFNVGSISKTFTAWGVMRLVERGAIELDAPVSRYLTRWSFPASEFDVDAVTVRRLLSHTAGLSLPGYPGWGPDDSLPSLEASLSGATNGSGDVRLVYEPGTDWRYSGGGYTVLQLVIEEVTGRPFDDYMRDEVLRPLGLTYSDFTIGPEVRARSSLAFDELGDPTPSPRFTARAAAGLHTTVHELALFALAAIEGADGAPPGRGLLSPETVALMTTPVEASGGTYGLGYTVWALDGGGTAIGHDGANRGWHAGFEVIPETGDGLVVVTNGSNGLAVRRKLFCDWVEAETGERPECPVSIATALVRTLLESDGPTAVRRYRELKGSDPEAYRFSQWDLNGLGYALLRHHRVEDAIAIFELNVEENPEASNPWDSLGEAYMVAGREAESIRAYRRSLELDPDNDNARAMLRRLEAG